MVNAFTPASIVESKKLTGALGPIAIAEGICAHCECAPVVRLFNALYLF